MGILQEVHEQQQQQSPKTVQLRRHNSESEGWHTKAGVWHQQAISNITPSQCT
jgi:hypothetical protein